MGRSKEALAAMQRFKELDPGYFPGKLMAIGIQFYWLRQYDNAIEQLKALNEMAPSYPNPYYWLGAAYLEKKDFNKAFDGFQKAVDYSHRAPVAMLGLAFAYARAGKITEAENTLAEVMDTSKKTYVPEFYVACVYGALGKKNEAFEWLNRTYKEHANGLSTIKVNPMLDDLRSDPRFSELLKKLKVS